MLKTYGVSVVCKNALCLVAQSSPTLCGPMNCSLPGSSVHRDFPGRMLEWVAIPSSRESSQPRDQTQVSHIAGGFFTIWATREAQYISMGDRYSGPVYPRLKLFIIRDFIHWAPVKNNHHVQGFASIFCWIFTRANEVGAIRMPTFIAREMAEMTTSLGIANRPANHLPPSKASEAN